MGFEWYFLGASAGLLIGTLLIVAFFEISDWAERRSIEQASHANPKVRNAYEATLARHREADRAAGL